MTGGKHTPGPWAIGDNTKQIYNHGIAYFIAGEKHEEIATLPVWGGSAMDEQRANAHLIATAPELLEALVGVHPYIADDIVRKRVGRLIMKARGE